jgi:hypothetical protein
MPITYDVDIDAGLVRLTGTGDVHPPEWTAVLDQVLKDSRHQPGMGILMDRRAITNTQNTAMITAGVDYFETRAALLGACRYATVVSDLSAYGMGRMMEQLTEARRRAAVEVRAFTDIGEAEQWLRQGL